ncbi:MAG: aminopeptidase P family protein [Planctomycetota bacterium]
MRTIIQNRLNRLKVSLSRENLDAVVVLVEENRRYLSSFTGEDTQFDESAGALIVTDADLILATDSRYELQAKRESPQYEIVTYKDGLAKALPPILKRLLVKNLGFESVRMSYKQHSEILEELNKAALDVKLVPTENLVEDLRIIKAKPEIDAIKAALAIAESVFSDCLPLIQPGVTEKELAWTMEKRLREAGANSLSFPTIVAAGPNSALPHAIPGSRKIKAGEPVLFDWGVKLNGYCSDISRTVVIGKTDGTFKKVFQTVLDAQRLAIDAVKPGISSKAVDEIARNYINAKGFKGKFGHGLGHGTGLAIHESPRLSPIKDTPLEPGMVSTIEPGIYLPDWGGVRLENMIVVRDESAEVLNQLDPANYRIEI